MTDEELPEGWTRSAVDAPYGAYVALDDGHVLWIDTPWRDAPLVAKLYDPAADRWSAAPPLRVAAMRRAITRTDEGWVHVSGGAHGERDARRVIDACELYKPATGEWLAMPPLPVACCDHRTVTVRGRVYVVGGRNFTSPFGVRAFASWAPGEHAWRVHPEPPRTFETTRAIVLDDDSIVAWGEPFYGQPGGAIRWDGDAWSAIGDIDDWAAVVAAPKSGLLEIGGSTGDEARATVRAWTPASGWADRPPIPKPRRKARAVRLADGRVAVFGGYRTEKRWEDTSDGGELDIEYRSFMAWVTYDIPHAEVLVSAGEDWRAVPAPRVREPRVLVGADGRVVVCESPLLFWTPPP